MRSLWIIRLSALGDVVLCEPAITALADRWPEAELTVVTRAAYTDLFRHHPRVAAVVTPAEARTLARPDLAVDLQNRVATRALALRGRRRFHWRKRNVPALWRAIRGRPLHTSYRGGPHQLERLAAGLGLPPLPDPRVHLSDAWRAEVDLPPGRWIALCPGASADVKRWPVACFADLARALPRLGARPLLVGGPADRDQLEALHAATGAPVLRTDLPLGVVAATLERCAAAVGNDSGLTHVAAAVGTPAVVLFGPTPPGRWTPRCAIPVSLDPPCGPCSDHGARPCWQPRRFCLDDLPPDAVLDALLSRMPDTRQTLRR